ncbi:MAG TPA: hypothetical protein PKI59_08200, partial [Candidatus Cloacimonadota bacterium]|nr:hypothetical protein [Candidatus Cloacimonadota bacterium]
MPKKWFLLFLLTIPILLQAEVFEPKLYIDGYYPLINNKVDVYKLDRGLNIYRAKPYEIPALQIERKETIDFPNQKVVISTEVAGQKLYPDVILSFDTYMANMRRVAFRKSLNTHIKQVTQQTQVSTSGLIREFVLELPQIAIPRTVQRVLGTKAGKLNLDGTQKITMGVSSTKRKQIPIYETDQKSTFDIKMEQETNLRLSGTIGEKIAVNLKYNSKQDEQLFDPNNVSIKYTG